MSSTKDLICLKCKHFDELSSGCKAFDEIPDEIIRKNKHDKPTKKQKNTLIFEPAN